jgi:hypothetical protein
MADQVALPAGYEDAKPATLRMPPGYEDARPVSTSAAPSLIQRMMQHLEPTPDQGLVSRFAKGFGRTTLGAVGGLVDAATREPDVTAGDLPVSDAQSYLGMLGKRIFVDPSIAANKHIDELAAEHGTTGTPAYYGGKIMADIPVLGPWGLQAGERAGKGDVAGALGETAGIALGPKILEKTPAVVRAVVPPVVRTTGRVLNTPGVMPAVGAGLGHMAGEGTAGAIIGHVARGSLRRLMDRMQNFGLPEESPPTYPGAPFPEAPPVYPGAPLPEHPGTFPGAPLPARPAPEVLQAGALTRRGSAPPPEPSAGLGRIPLKQRVAASAPSNVRTPGQIAPEMIRPRAYSPRPPAGELPPSQGPQLALPPARLVDQIRAPAEEPSLSVQGTKDYPRLIEQVKAAPDLSRPVTENPVVGNLVRAMDKSGVPIAQRPNLLLKGSGRVNRVLGPNEDLTDILAKSARQVRRQREQ